jgi:hypothetical protein
MVTVAAVIGCFDGRSFEAIVIARHLPENAVSETFESKA